MSNIDPYSNDPRPRGLAYPMVEVRAFEIGGDETEMNDLLRMPDWVVVRVTESHIVVGRVRPPANQPGIVPENEPPQTV